MSGNNPQIRQFVAAPGGESKEDKPANTSTERKFHVGQWVCYKGEAETTEHSGKGKKKPDVLKYKVAAWYKKTAWNKETGGWTYNLNVYKLGRWEKKSGAIEREKGEWYQKPDYWVLEKGRLVDTKYDVPQEAITKIAIDWEPPPRPPPSKRRRK